MEGKENSPGAVGAGQARSLRRISDLEKGVRSPDAPPRETAVLGAHNRAAFQDDGMQLPTFNLQDAFSSSSTKELAEKVCEHVVYLSGALEKSNQVARRLKQEMEHEIRQNQELQTQLAASKQHATRQVAFYKRLRHRQEACARARCRSAVLAAEERVHAAEASAREALAAAEERAAVLEERFQRERARGEAFEAEREVERGEVSDLARVAAVERSRADRAEREREAASAVVSALRSELTSEKTAAATARAETDIARQALAVERQRVARLERDSVRVADELRAETATLKGKLQRASVDKETAEETARALLAELSEKTQRLAAVEAARETLEATLAALRVEIQAERARTESERDGARRMAADAECMLTEQRMAIDRAQARAAAAEQERDELRAKHVSLEARVATAERAREDATLDVERAKQALAANQEALASAAAIAQERQDLALRLATAVEERRRAEARAAAAENRAVTAEAHSNELTPALVGVQLACQRLRERHEELRREAAQAPAFFSEQVCTRLKSALSPFVAVVNRSLTDEGSRISELQKQVISLRAQYEQEKSQRVEFYERYKKESTERKKLHNKLQELRGNIRVFCRVRPATGLEATKGIPCVTFPDEDEVCIHNPGNGRTSMFEFDRVFRPGISQEEVFEEAEPLMTSVMDGYNVCIFAYGQTGSGKTYTMEGPMGNRGVNYRALYELFHIAEERSAEGKEYTFEMGMLEIYNEQVYDLLTDRDEKLEIRTGASGNYVEGLHMVPVACAESVEALMRQGQRRRSTFATAMNDRSSRSHCIVQVHVCGKDPLTGVQTTSKLSLVDLAGSERLNKSEAVGDRLKEAQHINRSLSALGDVIAALAKKDGHIPYRNSRLTFLLQDSLGGEAKMLMFVQLFLWKRIQSCKKTASSRPSLQP
eukprot:tig00001085_g6942.t1